MFIYCEECGWETPDADEIEDLQAVIRAQGGTFETKVPPSGGYKGTCPKCGSLNLDRD